MSAPLGALLAQRSRGPLSAKCTFEHHRWCVSLRHSKGSNALCGAQWRLPEVDCAWRGAVRVGCTRRVTAIARCCIVIGSCRLARAKGRDDCWTRAWPCQGSLQFFSVPTLQSCRGILCRVRRRRHCPRAFSATIVRASQIFTGSAIDREKARAAQLIRGPDVEPEGALRWRSKAAVTYFTSVLFFSAQ